MKKILLSFLLCAACAGAAHAQYDYSSASRLDSIENAMSTANSRLAEMRADSIHSAVWKATGYFNLNYSIASTSTDIYDAQKAKFGVALNVGKSYLWPRKSAWGNMVKVGLDIRFIDVQFAMYDKFARPIQVVTNSSNPSYSGWTSAMNPSQPSDPATSDYYMVFDQMQVLAGLIGVGPTVTVAPLTFLNNAASSLRLNLYFHYQPTLGVNFYKSKCVQAPSLGAALDKEALDGTDMLTEMGYVNMMDWGFKIQWRTFGLGFECRWGSGKLSDSEVKPYINGRSVKGFGMNSSDPEGSYTRKYAESRVYLDFAF